MTQSDKELIKKYSSEIETPYGYGVIAIKVEDMVEFLAEARKGMWTDEDMKDFLEESTGGGYDCDEMLDDFKVNRKERE